MKTKHILFSLSFLALMTVAMVACQKEQISSTEGKTDAALLSSIKGMTTDYLSTVEVSTNKDGKWKEILRADLKGALETFVGTWVATEGSESQVVISSVASVIGGAAASIAASVQGNGGIHGGGHVHVPLENSENSFDNNGRNHYRVVHDVLENQGNLFDANNHLRFYPYIDHAYDLLQQEGMVGPGHRNQIHEIVLEANNNAYLGNQSLIAYMNGMNDPNFLPGEQAILAQYFAALMSSNDPDQFASYSINVENLISASTLGPKSKALLLSEMATARYGIAYWM